MRSFLPLNGNQKRRVCAERTSWPRAGLAKVYASDDRRRRQGMGGSSRAALNSSCLTALRRDRSARGASGAATGKTRPEV